MLMAIMVAVGGPRNLVGSTDWHLDHCLRDSVRCVALLPFAPG
jgi:hypothetical protein